MQNKLDDGRVIYTEYRHESGFVIREMLLKTRNTRLRYQAGQMFTRAKKYPCYTIGAGVSSHIENGEVNVFHMHGHGATLDDAVINAANKMLKAEIGE